MTEGILIIGAGKIGSALASILRDAGREFDQWDIDPALVRNQEPLNVLAKRAKVVVLCVPTTGIYQTAQDLGPDLAPDAAIFTVSKGIVPETAQLMGELLAAEFPAHATGLLYGPMLAEELLVGKMGAATVATESVAAYDKLATVFASTRLIVEHSSDVRGVALLGVLKNIYAVGLGIAAGLELGENAAGWLLATALREMPELLVALGGLPETMFTFAGAADLIATALSSTSKNHQYGKTLALGGQCGFAEGAAAIKSIRSRLHENHRLPFFETISACVVQGVSPREAFRTLLMPVSHA